MPAGHGAFPTADDCAGNAPGRDVLSFDLGADEFGIDVDAVQEIRSGDALAPIANAALRVKGAIQVRGVRVPVVDLRGAFDAGTTEGAGRDVVIVLKRPQGAVGIVVDAVSGVVSLRAAEIRPSGEVRGALAARYAPAIGAHGKRRLFLLDIERLLRAAEFKVPGPLPQ
jgi:purine-binding chemotaxis protein CheW